MWSRADFDHASNVIAGRVGVEAVDHPGHTGLGETFSSDGCVLVGELVMHGNVEPGQRASLLFNNAEYGTQILEVDLDREYPVVTRGTSDWPSSGGAGREPQWDARRLKRSWEHRHTVDDEELAVVIHLRSAPQPAHHFDGFVHSVGALPRVDDLPKSGQLASAVDAQSQPEHHAPVRESVERGDLSRQFLWSAACRWGDHRSDDHVRGRSRDRGERHPCVGDLERIFRGSQDVVPEEDTVPTMFLGSDGELAEDNQVAEGTERGNGEAVTHHRDDRGTRQYQPLGRVHRDMAMTAPDIFEGLNPAQHDAVLHENGPLLIVAGAGSGKTRVLTHRIAHLIDQGISPFEILAITFTNKAASEMKSRVGSLVGPVAEKMWVSTFHAACVRILRRDAARLDYPSSFSIYDQADAVRLTGYVIRDLGLDPKKFPPRSIHHHVSTAKNELISPIDYQDRATTIFERKIGDVYVEYQSRLHKAGAMDFDDLLTVTVELFRRCPDVLERYQQRFKHVMVDEYQDTNKAQNEIVLMLAASHRNICVVGDSDQSIYRFRGADIRNILEFEEAYPDTTVVVLDQNYRSTQTILDAANAVIAKNMGRKPKDLWTAKSGGDRISRFQGDDETEEAGWVAGEIARLHDQGDLRWSDVAVFYRTNAQSRVLEEHLVRLGLPYKVVGGTRFYDRREIKDAVAYLRAVVNPADEVSLKRIINTPKRGVGDGSVGKVDAWATAHGYTFMDALRRWEDAGVSGRAAKGIVQFLELLDSLAADPDAGPAGLLQRALDMSGYVDELRAERSIESEGRLENLAELIGSAEDFETSAEFLEQISLVADTDQLDDDESQIVVMTLHSAKGLEFPTVFILGMEDGIFPHLRALGDPEELEEERRLCYVGITRSQERLYLTNAWSRTIYGTTQYNPPSRFFDEIPAELLDDKSTPRGRSSGRSSLRALDAYNNGGSRPLGGSGFSEAAAGSSSGLSARQEERRAKRREAAREQIVDRAMESGTEVATSGPNVKEGDDVRHARYGEGVVLALQGSGDKTEVTIRFPEEGEKTFLLSWAPIEKV